MRMHMFFPKPLSMRWGVKCYLCNNLGGKYYTSNSLERISIKGSII